ncbi:MAG TPA: DUF6644 family protein [Bryobacteraceae bacterium]|nr:DUF6644 family protein [Bryobacteraceae bacterium]
MSLLTVCEWLQNMPWASGVKHSAWQFPVVESVHSLALSVMLWPAAILDLRLLGLVMRRRPVSQVASQFLPWTWTGFVVMVSSGVILFWSEAVKCYNSPFFRVKVILLAIAGVNALLFHTTVFRNVDAWDQDAATPWRAKLAGGFSLAVWIGVVAMGRALAYA